MSTQNTPEKNDEEETQDLTAEEMEQVKGGPSFGLLLGGSSAASAIGEGKTGSTRQR